MTPSPWLTLRHETMGGEGPEALSSLVTGSSEHPAPPWRSGLATVTKATLSALYRAWAAGGQRRCWLVLHLLTPPLAARGSRQQAWGPGPRALMILPRGLWTSLGDELGISLLGARPGQWDMVYNNRPSPKLQILHPHHSGSGPTAPQGPRVLRGSVCRLEIEGLKFRSWVCQYHPQTLNELGQETTFNTCLFRWDFPISDLSAQTLLPCGSDFPSCKGQIH